jgi:periplasmic protein TonB
MPRDLFGDVTRPSISIGNRKWYTVPVSLLSHSIVIAMIVVLPILAAPLMPGVVDNDDLEYITKILPPPPPPPAPRLAEVTPPVNPNAAPLVAPNSIAPEPPAQFDQFEATPVGVVGGADDMASVLVPPPVVAAPPEPQKPIRIGAGLRQPTKLRGADPAYPAIAQAARVQGIVIIEATIDADGRVVNARVLRSIPLLDQAALDAVRSWEYTPTMLNGVPVPVVMTVTVSIVLSR